MRSPFNVPLYTSFFSNKGISNKAVCPVRISAGAPRFKTRFKIEADLKIFAPSYAMRKMTEGDKFFDAYLEQIKALDKTSLAAVINALPHKDRPIVFLCFCDLRKHDFCHREILARWIEQFIGVTVAEYPIE